MKKLISSKNIYDGHVVKLFVDEVENEGLLLKREVVRHRGGASVLAELDGKFAFVRQYRHPFGEDFLELPAGTREKGEDPSFTAYRELQEECGLKAKSLKFICEYAVSPGYSSESLYLYYANDFEFVEQNLDSDEQLEVEWIDKRKALHMAKTGEIRDGKTLVALLWYIANRDEF